MKMIAAKVADQSKTDAVFFLSFFWDGQQTCLISALTPCSV